MSVSGMVPLARSDESSSRLKIAPPAEEKSSGRATSQLTSANRQVARASLIIMFTFAFSKVISLVSTLLLARAFNVNELDAFNAANTFPDILFNLVAGGALASAFVPTFTALVTVQVPDAAQKSYPETAIRAAFGADFILECADVQRFDVE